MRGTYLLALLPFLAIIGGVFFVNQVTPLIFGMPLLLAWIVLWILLTSAIMAAIYPVDRQHREQFAKRTVRQRDGRHRRDAGEEEGHRRGPDRQERGDGEHQTHAAWCAGDAEDDATATPGHRFLRASR